MKRLWTAILLLVMLLSMAACAREPAGTQAPGADASYHSKWIWVSGSTMGALTEQGYYYIPKSARMTLTYLDFASGQSVPLCSVVGCTHTGSTCEAQLETFSDCLFFHRDQLYYFHQDGTLRRRNALGGEEVTVGVLGKAFLEEGMNVTVQHSAIAGDYLYYKAMLQTTMLAGGGNTGYYLGRIRLSSGRDEVLLQQEITEGWSFQNIKLCAVRDGGMLFYHSEGIPVKSDDPSLIESSRDMKVFIKQWDAETGEVTTLMEKTRQDFLEVYLVDGGKVYFGGMADTENRIRPDLIAYDLETGQESVVWKQAHFVALGSGCGVLVQDAGHSILSLQTGKTAPITGVSLPYVDAVGPAGFATKNRIMGKDNPNTIAATVFCYVPYAALADGLTKEDLQTVYTLTPGFSQG